MFVVRIVESKRVVRGETAFDMIGTFIMGGALLRIFFKKTNKTVFKNYFLDWSHSENTKTTIQGGTVIALRGRE